MSDQPAKPKRESFYRHARATRITHWVNVLCIALLLMSGLNIFNAHPRLYWGLAGSDLDRPIAWIDAVGPPGKQRGMMVIGPLRVETTGVLGLSKENGELRRRAFPSWITIPSARDLGNARRWHFFFAWLFAINGLIYILFGVFNRHFMRDLAPMGDERVRFRRDPGQVADMGCDVHIDLNGCLEPDHRGGWESDVHRMALYARAIGADLEVPA